MQRRAEQRSALQGRRKCCFTFVYAAPSVLRAAALSAWQGCSVMCHGQHTRMGGDWSQYLGLALNSSNSTPAS